MGYSPKKLTGVRLLKSEHGKLNVLLIGRGYFPHRVTGDKNFFIQLAPIIAEHLDNLVILSINDQKKESCTQLSEKDNITIFNLSRALHLGDKKRFYGREGNLRYYHHFHGPIQEIVEQYITVYLSLPKISTIITKYRIDVIHFMDNCGPSINLIERKFKKQTIFCSAMAYTPRGLFYGGYLTYCFRNLDYIVPYSQAYKRKLVELGLPESTLRVIRWGVDIPRSEISEDEKRRVKCSLGYRPGTKLALWSGFIQQVEEEEFYQALNLAVGIVKEFDTWEFVFVFKPGRYKKRYALAEKRGIKIKTNIQDFLTLLESVDVFFSPIMSLNCIVAPPLTWLEAMARKTPIITTRIGGVQEIIDDRINGFVFEQSEDLKTVFKLASNDSYLEEISESAQNTIKKKFNIKMSAKKYLQLWQEQKEYG